MESALILDRVEAFYGKTQALFGVSLRLEPGTITTLLGANGAGKTTTLRAISQLRKTFGLVPIRAMTAPRCGKT